MDQRFRAKHRIRHGRDFKKVYDRRCSVSDDTLIVYGCENEFEFGRVGMSVSRKVGNAPTRNRWKRLIREAFRHNHSTLPPIDLVVIPRKGESPDHTRIQQSLPKLAERLAKKLTKPARPRKPRSHKKQDKP